MKHHPTDWDTKEEDRIRQPFKAPITGNTSHTDCSRRISKTVKFYFRIKICVRLVNRQKEYLIVSKLTICVLLPFAEYYVCEPAFPALGALSHSIALWSTI
jgi:hypothetical protein